MAEKGAHLTYTTLQKPSIFEVIAQESLSSTLQPAFRKIVEFVATINPGRYSWLLRWYDEVFLVVNSLLQYHYLVYHDASFAETFYGLRRISENTSNSVLSSREKYLSLLQLVVGPYFVHKFENIIEQLKIDGPRLCSEGKTRLINFTIKTHAVLHILWESLVLVCYFGYLGKNVHTHSPSLWACGLTLCNANENDPAVLAWEDVHTRWATVKKFGKGFLHALEIGAFCIQFLQWWNAEQYSVDLTGLPMPTPPPKVSEVTENVKNKCPLCMKQWHLETVLPVSGYVFCYRCIMHYVLEHGKCPVTGYPASTIDLVRLYK